MRDPGDRAARSRTQEEQLRNALSLISGKPGGRDEKNNIYRFGSGVLALSFYPTYLYFVDVQGDEKFSRLFGWPTPVTVATIDMIFLPAAVILLVFQYYMPAAQKYPFATSWQFKMALILLPCTVALLSYAVFVLANALFG